MLYCATPSYTTVGADTARFLYGWLRDPSLCYPSTLHLALVLPVLVR